MTDVSEATFKWWNERTTSGDVTIDTIEKMFQECMDAGSKKKYLKILVTSEGVPMGAYYDDKP